MQLDIHTQGKASFTASVIAFFASFTLTEVGHAIFTVLSIVALIYSIYCSRLTSKREQLERIKNELEIKKLEAEFREKEKRRHNKTGGK